MFAKAPVAGFVKTRLAKNLGTKQAARLYRVMALETFREARKVPKSRLFIAYQAHPKLPSPTWMSSSSRWFHQQGKGLGKRLIHAFEHVFQEVSGPVLVIGTDLPTLTCQRLEKAFQALRKVSVVIGPSWDGGYYLIGLRSPQPQLFRGIAWSSPKVFQQTLAAVEKSKLSYGVLPLERDIDTIQDMRSLIGNAK